jgi:hypothetical protein
MNRRGAIAMLAGAAAVSPGRLHVCADLQQLVRDACQVYRGDPEHPPRAIEGGAGWVRSELYGINAKAGDAAGPGGHDATDVAGVVG